MKLKLYLALLAAGTAHADPAFLGHLTTIEKGTLFRVTPSAGSEPRWVQSGASFAGYRIVEFNDKEESLVVEKDGQRTSLKLKESKFFSSPEFPEEDSIRDQAKKVLAKMEDWNLGVRYQIAKAPDGYWHVFATKVVNGSKELRLVRVSSDGRATNFSVLTLRGQ